jgi:hypothetical protein
MASNAACVIARAAWFRACLGLCTQWQAPHSREWRVLVVFWREKAGAGRVPSFISGCAAAKMLEAVFSRIIRMA